MLTGNYVSLLQVAERVFKTGLNEEEIHLYDIVEWAGQAIQKIGVPSAYVDVVTNGIGTAGNPITIADYRGTLPTNIVTLTGVREDTYKYPMVAVAGSFPPTYTTNNLKNAGDATMLGYRIENGYIYTNFEEGAVELSYKAFLTDTNGFPKIPDKERYIEAIVAYCNYMLAKRLWLQDRLADKKFELLEQDWLFYVNSAKTIAHMPDLDGAESLKNQLLRMRQSSYHHAAQFAYLNTPEITKVIH